MKIKNKKTINQYIKQSFVKIVKDDGSVSGAISTQNAIKQAREAGLDLVLVGVNGDEGVCKICDANTYFYKLAKENKNKIQKPPKLKSFNFRCKIDDHDKNITLKKVHSILDGGDNVKISMFLTKREKDNPTMIEDSKKFLTEIVNEVSGYARAETHIDDLFIVLSKKK
jgi:translation initiation factor IF-3